MSLIKQAFEGLCVNDFKGLKLETNKPGDAETGDQILERLAFGDSTVSGSILAEGRIILANYLFTYWLLKSKRQKYQKLETSDIGLMDNYFDNKYSGPVIVEEPPSPSDQDTKEDEWVYHLKNQ